VVCLFVIGLVIFCFCILFLFFLFGSCLVVSTSAVDCLERPVAEMTCYVSSGTLTHCIILLSMCNANGMKSWPFEHV